MKRTISAGDRGEELIGIWWYTDDGQVFGYTKPADQGYNDFGNIQYDKVQNHMTLFRKALTDFIQDESKVSEYISKGYKSIYRGRVFYETATMCYVITCSSDLVNCESFRNSILGFFNLRNSRYEFRPLNHYKDKIELTGNPSVDSLYYEL